MKRFLVWFALLALGGPLLGQPSSARDTVFQGVRVFTGAAEGDAVLEGRSVLVRDGRIAGVAPAAELEIPEGARVVDGAGRTLMPGLFDLHVHLTGPASRFDRRIAGDPALHARQNLACGVTSILDLNADEAVVFPLRDRLSREGEASPRLFCAGAALTAPGGHGTQESFPGRVVPDPADAAGQVAALLRRRPDVVKVMLDAGGWGGHPPCPVLDEAALRAAIEAAHRGGARVVVHAVDVALMKLALRAGADAIAHAPIVGEVDDELIELFLDRDAALITTLAAYRAGFAAATDGEYFERSMVNRFVDPRVVASFRDPAWVVEQSGTASLRFLRQRWPRVLDGVGRLAEAGVTVLPGTDAGFPAVFHGEAMHRELAALVEAGLSPDRVLRAATSGAARFLGVGDRVGEVTVGRQADLVLVQGRPDRRISDSRRVERVMVGGRMVDREAIAVEVARRAAAGAVEAVGADAGGRTLFDFESRDGRLPPHGVVTDGDRRDKTTATAASVAELGGDGASRFLRLEGKVVFRAPTGGFAGVTLPLGEAPDDVVDLSEFRGIILRARSDAPRPVRVLLRTTNVKDYDFFSASIPATPDWREFRIPFDGLAQVGFGKRVRFDLRRVTAVEFRTGMGEEGPFRIDVDDVGLWRD